LFLSGPRAGVAGKSCSEAVRMVEAVRWRRRWRWGSGFIVI
jgi:hypothetical protein